VPWAALAEAVTRWRAAARFERFFFVRKPPGLRLRFGGHALAETLEPELATWLAATERRNDIRSFRFGRYEPECHRFGGPAGTAIAHDLFDVDAGLALRFESDDAGASRPLLSMAVCQDLFRHTLDDGAEVWDVWKRLEEIVRRAANDRSEPDPEIVAGIRAMLAGTVADPAGILDAARDSHRRVAAALIATGNAGRLSRAPRAWLTAASTFHWNRWGLPLEMPTFAAHVAAMATALEPDLP
jgi:thiopeptide-type bacteriocin biosynthesis protein